MQNFGTKQGILWSGRFNGTMQNGAGPTLVERNLGYFCTKSPVSRLVWQIDRRCLGLPGFFGDGRFNGTKNVVGPTLVAMATKFRLGAEIRTPTGLLLLLLLRLLLILQLLVLCSWCFLRVFPDWAVCP